MLYNQYVNSVPLHFIDEEIDVVFEQPPMLEKQPPCPNAFAWRGATFQIVELLEEWRDNHRRGRSGTNMRPTHLSRSETIGSWGVGRFHFRVITVEGRIFEIYYDRAPGNASDRKGHWFLWTERRSGAD
jgi:hypothetical protein